MIEFEAPKPIAQQEYVMQTVAENMMRPVSRYFDENEHEIPWDYINFMHQAMLATGAFISAILISAIILTVRKQWRVAIQAPFSIHKWGILSGLFHYGGNIIHTYSTAFLSSAISWPLGISGGFCFEVGGQAHLRRLYGLDAESLVDSIRDWAGSDDRT